MALYNLADLVERTQKVSWNSGLSKTEISGNLATKDGGTIESVASVTAGTSVSAGTSVTATTSLNSATLSSGSLTASSSRVDITGDCKVTNLLEATGQILTEDDLVAFGTHTL